MLDLSRTAVRWQLTRLHVPCRWRAVCELSRSQVGWVNWISYAVQWAAAGVITDRSVRPPMRFISPRVPLGAQWLKSFQVLPLQVFMAILFGKGANSRA